MRFIPMPTSNRMWHVHPHSIWRGIWSELSTHIWLVGRWRKLKSNPLQRIFSIQGLTSLHSAINSRCIFSDSGKSFHPSVIGDNHEDIFEHLCVSWCTFTGSLNQHVSSLCFGVFFFLLIRKTPRKLPSLIFLCCHFQFGWRDFYFHPTEPSLARFVMRTPFVLFPDCLVKCVQEGTWETCRSPLSFSSIITSSRKRENSHLLKEVLCVCVCEFKWRSLRFFFKLTSLHIFRAQDATDQSR